jgi:hypothetical protein
MLSRATLIATGALAAALFNIGTANASTSSYIASLQEEIPYVVQQYGEQALIDEGYKVCAWTAQGVPDVEAGGIIDRIERDLPMSDHAAINVKVDAEHDLGC